MASALARRRLDRDLDRLRPHHADRRVLVAIGVGGAADVDVESGRAAPVDADQGQVVLAGRQDRVEVDRVAHRVVVAGAEVADLGRAGAGGSDDVEFVVALANFDRGGHESLSPDW